jgi:hypothetical protein
MTFRSLAHSRCICFDPLHFLLPNTNHNHGAAAQPLPPLAAQPLPPLAAYPSPAARRLPSHCSPATLQLGFPADASTSRATAKP